MIDEDQDVANLKDVVDEWDQLGDTTDAKKVMQHTFVADKTRVIKAITAARKARNTKTYNPKANYD